jgi:hypothetical protein
VLQRWTVPPAWNHKRGHHVARHGVERVLINRPAGMPLYGLSEWADTPPYRRFVFAN